MGDGVVEVWFFVGRKSRLASEIVGVQANRERAQAKHFGCKQTWVECKETTNECKQTEETCFPCIFLTRKSILRPLLGSENDFAPTYGRCEYSVLRLSQR